MRLLKSIVAAGFAALLGAQSATAGDYDWSGHYVGGVGSAGLYAVEQEDYWCWGACNAPTLQDWQASIGLQAGHYWQSGNLVYGIVGDISTGFDDSSNVVWSSETNSADYDAEWNYYATLRGRVGLATGNALLFATGGIAIVDVDYSAVVDNNYPVNGKDCSLVGTVDCASHSGTEVGFAGGVGTAFPVGDKMHMTFEYLFIGLPMQKDRYDSDEETNPDDTDDFVSWTTSAHLGRVSLVWEFDGM